MCERCRQDEREGRTPSLFRLVLGDKEIVSLTVEGQVVFHTSDHGLLAAALAKIGDAAEKSREALFSGPEPEREGHANLLTHLSLVLGAMLNEMVHLERHAARAQALGEVPLFSQPADTERN